MMFFKKKFSMEKPLAQKIISEQEAIEIVKKSPPHFKNVGQFINDASAIKFVLEKDALLLEHVSTKFKEDNNNIEYLKGIITKTPEAIQFAPAKIKSDMTFVLPLVKKHSASKNEDLPIYPPVKKYESKPLTPFELKKEKIKKLVALKKPKGKEEDTIQTKNLSPTSNH